MALVVAWGLALAGAAGPATAVETSTRLDVDAPQGTWGRPLVMAALVRGPKDQPTPSEGWVTFLDDGKPLGTRPLVAGKALLAAAHLPSGPHHLTALYGGTAAWAPSASATRRVIVEPSAPPPRLEIWALPDGATARFPAIAVRGRATSLLGTPRVEVAGLEVPVDADGTFTWALLGREGENRITILARDRAGRETRETRNVRVTTSTPWVRLDPPGDGAGLPDPEVTVTGDLQELPGGAQEARLSYAVNGGPFSQVPVQDGAFAFSVALESGPNVLWVRLDMPDGSGSWACRTLFRRPGPALDIQVPPDPTLTSLDTLTLTGAAPGQVDLTLDTLTLLLAAPRDTFTAEMPLSTLGIHMATARIQGPDGEALEVRRPIIRAAYKVPALFSLEDVKRALDIIVGLETESMEETFRMDIAPLGTDQGWGDQRLAADDAAVLLTFAQGIW